MVSEGTAGTADGDGLAANLDGKCDEVYSLITLANGFIEAESTYGKSGAQAFYYAARLYNSGEIDGNLGNADGATPCYVSDVANRLLGWVTADSTCDL